MKRSPLPRAVLRLVMPLCRTTASRVLNWAPFTSAAGCWRGGRCCNLGRSVGKVCTWRDQHTSAITQTVTSTARRQCQRRLCRMPRCLPHADASARRVPKTRRALLAHGGCQKLVRSAFLPVPSYFCCILLSPIPVTSIEEYSNFVTA